jgi:hypothetical protein
MSKIVIVILVYHYHKRIDLIIIEVCLRNVKTFVVGLITVYILPYYSSKERQIVTMFKWATCHEDI